MVAEPPRTANRLLKKALNSAERRRNRLHC
jgi:hypothetical protein